MEKKIITVTTESAFKNAVENEYDIILIAGDYSHEIAKKIKGSKTMNQVSNLAVVGGFFLGWPILIAGIAGKVFSKKIKNYEVSEIDEEFITVKRKIK